jgi:branched-chain amino acid transport system substrate-binding protein
MAVSGALLLAGCSSASSTPAASVGTGPILIGAAIAKSGFIASYDQPPYQSLLLKIKDINAAGGINGRKITFKEVDTGSDIARGGQAAKQLIEQGADIILTSCDFDYGGSAALVAQKAGLVSISLCASSPKFGVQGIGDKAFTFSPSVGNQAAVLATFAIQKKWKKAYILLDDSLSYTKGMNSAFTKFFPKLGGKIIGTSSFANADSSIATQIAALKAANPDVILLDSYPPGGAAALRQIRAAGINTPVMDGDAFDGTYWVDAVPDLNNFYLAAEASVQGDDGNPAVNNWVKAYTKAYGSAPTKGQAVLGFAIGEALQKALTITKGSTDGKALAKAMESFKNEKLIIGATSFSATDHIPLTTPMPILLYTGGKPAYLKTVKPAVKATITDGIG